MDSGRIVHRGRWPSSPPTKRCSSACSACPWRRINERDRRAGSHGRRRHRRDPASRASTGAARCWSRSLALVALPLIGTPSTWVTLTVAGLAMGMMIFIMASGLTLVFGLMDVLNFGARRLHRGRRVRRASACCGRHGRLDDADERAAQPGRDRSRRCWPAPRVAGVLGWVFERRASCGRSTAST